MSFWNNAKISVTGDLTGFVKVAPVGDLCDTCNDAAWEPNKTLHLCDKHLKEATVGVVDDGGALMGRKLFCKYCNGPHTDVNCLRNAVPKVDATPKPLVSAEAEGGLSFVSAPKGDSYKLDRGKTVWALLADMAPGLAEVARVLEYGAEKYTRHGWIHEAQKNPKKVKWTRSTDAAQRHIYGGDTPDGWKDGWLQGVDIDPESNCNHLAHAVCDLLFALTYQLKELGYDDRSE